MLPGPLIGKVTGMAIKRLADDDGQSLIGLRA